MKILKIEEHSALFYSFSTNEYVLIDKIDKKSLLELINYILKEDNPEIDIYVENIIINNVQDIIYKDISEKLNQLINEKGDIIHSIKSQYSSAIDKYTQ